MKITVILCALMLPMGLLTSCCDECASSLSQEEFVKAVETQIAAIGAKMTELKAKAGEEYEEAAADLKELKKDADQKIEELKSASAQAWEDLKPEVNAALDHLKQGFEKVRARFE